jgi:outer membrane protein assembly factor BamA
MAGGLRRYGVCRWLGLALPAAALLLALNAIAFSAWPTVREIAFCGNYTTRQETMLREMTLHVGDPADPARIEASRQAIQDLGLFRSVSVESTTLRDGVRLLFTVREKFNVLPVPRVEGNGGGDYGYGAQLRWNNLWGLNHTLTLQAMRRHYHDPDKTSDSTLQFGYSVPFFDGGPYGLSTSLGLRNQNSLDAQGNPYRETFQNLQLLGTYALGREHPSNGWSLAAGLDWQRDAPSGRFAPHPPSYALGPVLGASLNDLRYLIYSEEGQRFRVTTQLSLDGVAANYNSSATSLSYRRDWHLGSTPHQTLELLANGGFYLGGAEGHRHDFYSLGGQRVLRGYPSSFSQGDYGYYAGVSWLRPVRFDWLRLLVVAEAGNTYDGTRLVGRSPVYASIGLGLRARVNWLVNLELEAGAAVPLVDGHGVRLFAGTVNQGR